MNVQDVVAAEIVTELFNLWLKPYEGRFLGQDEVSLPQQSMVAKRS